jgi:putative Ca2+/H+ antiporter (TMEM165/GDT1 family)
MAQFSDAVLPRIPKTPHAATPVFLFGTTNDKTQFATIALAASYSSLPAMVAGSTFAIMLAVAPAMFLMLGVIILLGIGVWK